MDSSSSGSFHLWISQARILKWIAIYFSKGSSWPSNQTHVSCLVSGFFTIEPPGKLSNSIDTIKMIWYVSSPRIFIKPNWGKIAILIRFEEKFGWCDISLIKGKNYLREDLFQTSLIPWWVLDFPGGSDGKASAYNAGDPGSIPGWGRSPGEGNGNPLQYSCLENPMDGGA